MAASQAPPHHPSTAGSFLPPSCSYCLVVILLLGCLTAFFMVTCLSLSFKLSKQSRRRRDLVTTSVPVELWAAPPSSQSQTNLLWPTEPALSPPPPLNDNLDGAMFRQPRVTLQDIDEFWWRNYRDL